MVRKVVETYVPNAVAEVACQNDVSSQIRSVEGEPAVLSAAVVSEDTVDEVVPGLVQGNVPAFVIGNVDDMVETIVHDLVETNIAEEVETLFLKWLKPKF